MEGAIHIVSLEVLRWGERAQNAYGTPSWLHERSFYTKYYNAAGICVGIEYAGK